MIENRVTAFASLSAYCPEEPFSPGVRYPEYDYGAVSAINPAYDSIRNCLAAAGLDAGRFATSRWNPLQSLIRPGETVLLKPNLVKEDHPRDPNGWSYVLTHGSVIRAVADYVWKAVGPHGKVIVADAPQTDSSFELICRRLGLYKIRDFYCNQGLDFQLLDLRREEWVNDGGVIVRRQKLAGDPKGYVAFDLGAASEFHGHPGEGRYYGADYDCEEVNRHHSGGKHEYLVSRTAIEADVVFSLPKLKTHKKTGLTAALKNLVGINGDKNWLPHHTDGPSSLGGDEHPLPNLRHRTERGIVDRLRKLSLVFPTAGPRIHRHARTVGARVFGRTEEVVRSGNWWGNDTAWRMCLDLNKVLAYGNHDGSFRQGLPENRKRHYVLVDAIVAGQGRGPMNPDPLPAGLVLFGLNPPSVDAACALLMGFEPSLIPLVRQSFCCAHYPLAEWRWEDVLLDGSRPEWHGTLPSVPPESAFVFEPHFGWKRHIERLWQPERPNVHA